MGDEQLIVGRWSIEQIEAIAPSAASMSAARPIATPGRWKGTGADDDAVWGSFAGGGAEPYDTIVDHVHVRFRCTCPSRRFPCKHALALLLLWVNGHVPSNATPPAVASWLRSRVFAEPPGAQQTPDGPQTPDSHAPEDRAAPDDRVAPEDRAAPEDRTSGRDDRVARMRDGLDELDRWLVDRMRTGLADPSLAQFATWDGLAARLVDARAGSLANRVRRLAGLVGATPDWHERVLEEIGILHLLAQAGLRLGDLPDGLGDRVATTVGWQIRQADVLDGVPETDVWFVAGRSDTREDRIEVRRHWLYGTTTNRWALLLSFAAYRQSLETSLTVGTSIQADLHRYPGGALRTLLEGRTVVDATRPEMSTIVAACQQIGAHIAREPWLDRMPALVRASPTLSNGRWVITDDTGSLPLAQHDGIATLLALSAGEPVDLTVEWMTGGISVLAIHRADGSIDIGPRAEASFVGAA